MLSVRVRLVPVHRFSDFLAILTRGWSSRPGLGPLNGRVAPPDMVLHRLPVDEILCPVRIGRCGSAMKAEVAQPTQPFPDQIFHPRVAYVVLPRQHFQHRHRIKGQTAALRLVPRRRAPRLASDKIARSR
jgi:hypothetical protein